MNFDELNEIVSKQANVRLCPICGTPYKQYHSRQKTCGSSECKKMHHSQWIKDYRRKQFEEHPDEFRAYRREMERKCRQRKKDKERMSRNYDKLEAFWSRNTERHVETDGLEYGKKQAERTLAQGPKIDVSGFEKRDK